MSRPMSIFNRQREPRARATGRMLAGEAKLRIARADGRMELESAWGAFETAVRTLDVLGATSTLVERDSGFIEQAVRAGAFDAMTRSLALRRLEDAGRRLDTAVRDYRAARAAWIRRSLGLQP